MGRQHCQIGGHGLSFDIDAMVRSDIDDKSKFYPPTGPVILLSTKGLMSVLVASSDWQQASERCNACSFRRMSEASAQDER